MTNTATERYETQRADLGSHVGSPSLRLVTAPADRSVYQRLGKRLVDLTVATVALALVAPILLTAWLALRLALGRGIVLRQDRIGRNGETFGLFKLRTMQHCRRDDVRDPEWDGFDRRRTHKSDDDPRHIPLGRLIRKFSIDELPQLVNIVRGDMSLVGPRPELAAAADADFLGHARHQVRPGLTGPFQTSDLRGTGDLRLGLELDADYVADVRLRHDVRYLLRTVRSLVRGTGS